MIRSLKIVNYYAPKNSHVEPKVMDVDGKCRFQLDDF